jgi:hypothetical protein
MMKMRTELFNALEKHLEAHVDKHRVNVLLLLENPVGVAEHPDLMETIEGELEQMAHYTDKLEMLRKYF